MHDEDRERVLREMQNIKCVYGSCDSRAGYCLCDWCMERYIDIVLAAERRVRNALDIKTTPPGDESIVECIQVRHGKIWWLVGTVYTLTPAQWWGFTGQGKPPEVS